MEEIKTKTNQFPCFQCTVKTVYLQPTSRGSMIRASFHLRLHLIISAPVLNSSSQSVDFESLIHFKCNLLLLNLPVNTERSNEHSSITTRHYFSRNSALEMTRRVDLLYRFPWPALGELFRKLIALAVLLGRHVSCRGIFYLTTRNSFFFFFFTCHPAPLATLLHIC